MADLVRARGSWLTRPRRVGTPVHWARGGALYGGLLAFFSLAAANLAITSTLSLVPWLVFHPLALLTTATAMAIGGTLGLAQPALLERVRGRVPLPVLMLGQAGVGAVAGAAAVWVWADPLILGVSALVGGLSTLVHWLPFTVATVMGARTWPVTVAAATATSLSVLLALALIC